MSEVLKSVGLDIGTTSTQLVLSELTIENKASSFAVPELEIVQRKILYRSPIHFTPLLDDSHMDAPALRRIVEAEYQKAGITRETVDTGAVIITGETSRKENARAVLEALADLAGDFVAAAAGPDLESVLAAKGAGAVDVSERTGKTVLHMDIGGGTSNLCLIREGRVEQTGCLNVGGRLVKVNERGTVTYVSPVLRGLTDIRVGQVVSRESLEPLAGLLTWALEMAAGRREVTPLLPRLTTEEVEAPWEVPKEDLIVSFSGGVADCIEKDRDWSSFGDIGVILGQEIRKSALCRGAYLLGKETIRATVIGAGCHSAQLSGSTVFHQNVTFPMKNLPVVGLSFSHQEERPVLSLPRLENNSYAAIAELAEDLAKRKERPLILSMEQDMAKALGQLLALRLGRQAPILCIDRVRLRPGSFLDIGAPVENAIPVVVKTLVLGTNKEEII